MDEWKEYKLEEIVLFQRGHDLPRTNMIQGTYPVAGSNGIIGYHNSFTTKGPGVTIGRSGNIGNPKYYESDYWAHNTVLYVKEFRNAIPKYIYYFLLTFDFSQFNAGSAVPTLNRNHIHDLRFYFPEIPEQRTIATILSSLDDKIDLLHCQNKTLEQLAETLFRQWFVEEVDESWEVGTFGDVINIFDSKRIPLSSMERDKMKYGTLYPYYGAATIMDYINDYIFDGEYILMGEDGTVETEDGYPILQMPVGKFWVNNHTHIFTAKQPYTNYLIYIFLKLTNISNIVTGAVQPKINQEMLKSIIFSFPPAAKTNDFIFITNQYWNKIKTNNNQIRTLTQLRDTLLPKLMSGEIRLNCDLYD
ncbi:MAG: restriction endonuclease subunit S [Ignavibacteriales bacterium]|nr:restriction endonuclease subunit S [Ignavibacteriales bacterium]